MVEKPAFPNPFLDAWVDAGRHFLREASGPSPAVSMSDAITRAEETWRLCQRQVADWITVSSRWFPEGAGADSADGVAGETLRRMLDPARFLYAGTDEINQAIRRLVEGPELADIGALERQVLKATREWLALREASSAYRNVVSAAWNRAFITFSQELATDPGSMRRGPRSILDRWLGIANEELIRTQRTEAFLKAQRDLLAAGVAYRIKERELVEVWCETHSIPTRTEVDDLHRTVHELRSQVRELKTRLAAKPAASPPAEATDATPHPSS